VWDAFFVKDIKLPPPKPVNHLAMGILAAALLAACPWSAWAAPADTAETGWRGGFSQPVPVIPEIGLWADAMTELGYGTRAGLLVWWGLDPSTAVEGSAAAEVDWSQITFRVRVEVFDLEGNRVEKSEKLIDPPESDEFSSRGGFPAAEHVVMDLPGRYRARIEAYPLISAEEVGLDSVPRGVVEVDAKVAERSISGGPEWLISDLMFLDALEDWVPGSPSERTWYEWIIFPSVPRSFVPDSAGAYVAFEIERGEELVPLCARRHCRVVISILDEHGGIVQQALRQVPEAASVSAYVVPFETINMHPGRYHARVEVFEGGSQILSVSRAFATHEGKEMPAREDED
jgi:hypothetical protein